MSSDTAISVPAHGLGGCHHSSLKGFSSMSLETSDFFQLLHEQREEGGSLEMLMTLFDEVRKRYHAEATASKNNTKREGVESCGPLFEDGSRLLITPR